MQRIFEPLFDITYLVLVITLGIQMIKKGKNSYIKKFGIMALILGFGDAFHLIPRMYSLLTNEPEAYTLALGIGKLITSITMTIFYLILYDLYKSRFQKNKSKLLDFTIYLLAFTRIALCLFPQNQWTSLNSSYSWGIYRNIPFIIMGIIIVTIILKQSLSNNDKVFLQIGISVVLSFLFYIPVVLFASTIPLLGMLMIPKTCAYLWIVWVAYKEMNQSPISYEEIAI
ncbi:hypothetical protein [Clostridium sp. DL1XJH146]